MFASFNQICGKTTSARDDIQAALLVLIYLLNDEKLPWSDLCLKKIKTVDDAIKMRQQTSLMREVLKMTPIFLQKLFKKVLCLKYEQKPDYEEIL